MWPLWPVLRSIRNEYMGWRGFRNATGMWPVCSILADIFSVPLLLAGGIYGFIAALETRRLAIIYAVLIFGVISAAAAWYGLRRLACKADLARGRKSDMKPSSAQALEALIR